MGRNQSSSERVISGLLFVDGQDAATNGECIA